MIPIRHLFSRLSPFLFTVFTAVLVVAGGTALRAQAQVPTITDKASMSTFTDAVQSAETEDQLVGLATTLLKARANTKISFNTYQKGILTFATSHPDFYGNFFGDPYAATYDVDYFRMDRIRHKVGYEVEPVNGLAGMFACNPVSYDPAFQGFCRGFRFATADFFFLPLRPESASFAPDLTPIPLPNLASTARTQRSDTEPQSRRAQTNQNADSDAEYRDRDENTDSDRAVDDIQIPEDVVTRMQERAWTLQRQAAERRIQRLIERRYGTGHTLTPHQRSRITSELAQRRWRVAPDEDSRYGARTELLDEAVPRRTFDEQRTRSEYDRQQSRSQRNTERHREREQVRNERPDPPERVRDAREAVERSKKPSRDSDDEGS